MITQKANRGGTRGRRTTGGFSRLWIPAILLGVIILIAIAAVNSDEMPTLTGKLLLGITIPLFFGVSFAAIGRDAHRRDVMPLYVTQAGEGALEEDEEDQDVHPASEAHQVYSWRRMRLVRLGVSTELTAVLAAEPAFSVHDLDRLLAAGCPLGTALRILQPD